MAAFVAGVAADAVGGDPPSVVHPVRAVGLVARAFEDAARRRWAPRTAGAVGAVAIPTAAAIVAMVAERSARRRPLERVGKAAGALALASAQRTLMQRALEVAAALEEGDLGEARRLLAYHLVSRPTEDLNEQEVAGAVIESVAENLGDGVAGPWLAFALAGSGGAWAYRALNTLDSLWGYRDSRYVDFGRAAAKLDDFVNLVPARAAALSICLASRRRRRARAFTVWRRDAGLTESPNAGHPMAAMAGALGVELTKRGHYTLGVGGHPPEPSDIRDAVEIARASCIVLAGICLVVIFLRGGR